MFASKLLSYSFKQYLEVANLFLEKVCKFRYSADHRLYSKPLQVVEERNLGQQRGTTLLLGVSYERWLSKCFALDRLW